MGNRELHASAVLGLGSQDQVLANWRFKNHESGVSSCQKIKNKMSNFTHHLQDVADAMSPVAAFYHRQ